jgi:AraC-like DNA-binding protein
MRALSEFLATVNGEERDVDLLPRVASAALPAVRDYLHDRATEQVTLAQLVSVAGLSPCHLVRAFRRAYGLPPHRYQTALRIDRATRQLLRPETRTIGEVAHPLGFADHAHCTRAFRRSGEGRAGSRQARHRCVPPRCRRGRQRAHGR